MTRQHDKRLEDEMKMIGCYVTGTLPRSKELIEATRAHDRKKLSDKELEKAFEEDTLKVVKAQISTGLSYVTDGMLKWQDPFRPFTENLKGLKVGGLARWFNNNAFYRKPVVIDEIYREKNVIANLTYTKHLPMDIPWKAILPAPYTFAKLSENKFYKDETELMFKYAQILRDEIESLTEIGFKYVQLSDPALVYNPSREPISKDVLASIREVLKVAVRGAMVKTCLQTFFGDFSQILPEALDFPVNDLGIDLYETNIEKLKEYNFEKGVALGLLDSRNSLIEDEDELVMVAEEIIEPIYPSKICDVFICPNCDMEFLPWERAEEKLKVIGKVAKRLKNELS